MTDEKIISKISKEFVHTCEKCEHKTTSRLSIEELGDKDE